MTQTFHSSFLSCEPHEFRLLLQSKWELTSSKKGMAVAGSQEASMAVALPQLQALLPCRLLE